MIRWAVSLWLALASVALAIDPSEVLDDPALEAQARGLYFDLRCVVCQSEALASSNAQWAVDARAIVREQVIAGRSDAEIKAFFVERYGEFVLMEPPKTGSNLLLWAAGPLMLLVALIVAFTYVRRRAAAPAGAAETGLTEEENARLKKLLEE